MAGLLAVVRLYNFWSCHKHQRRKYGLKIEYVQDKIRMHVNTRRRQWKIESWFSACNIFASNTDVMPNTI